MKNRINEDQDREPSIRRDHYDALEDEVASIMGELGVAPKPPLPRRDRQRIRGFIVIFDHEKKEAA
jgi:hypothetical protein